MDIFKLRTINNLDIERVINCQLFFHYFQPIMDVVNEELYGFEGLLRSLYIENPEELFKIAKETNRLMTLDVSSFYKAIKYFDNETKGLNLDTHLFLNVFPSTIASPSFFTCLDSLFTSLQMPRENLVLEVNELEKIDISVLSGAVNKFQKAGFQVALDDIGKGDSSLAKIIELEPSFIKLDKYFAKDLYKSINKQKMVKFFLEYGFDNEIIVVLEGIETEEDFSVAKALGVQFVQGYLLGKPDLLKNYLKTW